MWRSNLSVHTLNPGTQLTDSARLCGFQHILSVECLLLKAIEERKVEALVRITLVRDDDDLTNSLGE